ncbi:serine hydrolase, partial [Bradyrhizobium sp. NBAIM08]|uniref:serine hydrolase n=1 Tax=Bradyrhizobium sp. NBAIM08 TaxID=2793815 RepID=UPI001CD2EC29
MNRATDCINSEHEDLILPTNKLNNIRITALHTAMSGYVERGDIPGLVTLIARSDEIHVDAIGTKCIDGNDPILRDTIFRIASITKPITAAAT